MTKSQQHFSRAKRKSLQIDQLVELWRRYHEKYRSLYLQYTELITNRKPGRHPKKMSVWEYRPDWACYLLLNDEEEVRSALVAKRCNAVSTIARECHECSIEVLIRLLSGEIKTWHYWQGAGAKGGSTFGAIPGSCRGVGRHFGGDSSTGEYS